VNLRGERGSGSLLGIAVMGSLAALFCLTTPLYLGLTIAQSVSASADAAALAGADVASGIAPGDPCGVAAEVASADGTNSRACSVDGLDVTVRVDRVFFGLELSAVATAGPPDSVTN
jgi:secretion/DNA translocation related TadE-like protein